MRFEIYPSREALMTGLAGQVAADLRKALAAKGCSSLTVPGGTTPGPVFDALTAIDLDWSRVAIFLNDERWIGEDSPRSNTRLLRERLLQGFAAPAQLIPLYAEAAEPEDRLDELARGLAPHLPVDVAVLGMGVDMHTASLFPGADKLAEALAEDAPPLMAMRSEAAGEPRITLTAPVLAGAGAIHILITGAQKRAAIERAQALSPLEAPISVVLPRAFIHWAE
jgi:6-phosphogluconolactonase